MPPARFDLGALFAAIDAERRRQDLSWAALGRSVGVSASTIRRFETATDAEADGVLALVRWLGDAPEVFLSGESKPAGRPLPSPAVEGMVRVDMALVAEASSNAAGAEGRSRTTIQRLAHVAQEAGRPVASLTRVSLH